MKPSIHVFWVFLVCILGPLIVLSLLFFVRMNSVLTRQALTHLDTLASIQKSRAYTLYQTHLKDLESFSSRRQLRVLTNEYLSSKSKQTQEQILKILLDAKLATPEYRTISVISLEGEVIASTERERIGTSVADADFFQKGKLKENVTTFFKNTQNDVLLYLTGPLQLDSKPVGVIAIETDTTDLFSLFRDHTGLGMTGEWGLTQHTKDGDGLIVVPGRFDTDPSSPLKSIISKEKTKAPTVRALAGQEGIFADTVDYRGTPVLAATRYIPEADWAIGVKIAKSEAFGISRDLGSFLALLVVIFAALSILFYLYIVRQLRIIKT